MCKSMYEVEHTSEHIFVRALQNLGKDILVKKVEHGDVSRVYIESYNLMLDDIYKAECIANEIIEDAKDVREYIFDSLEEAKKIFPDLRAYEARIEGKTRVIEILGYDHAACIKDHVNNTKLCEFFIVKHVSRERNVYRIEFLAGKRAKIQALEFGIRCLKMVNDLNVSMDTLEASIRNMKNDLALYKKRLTMLSKQIVESIIPSMINGIRFYKASFEMLDDNILIKKAGELIKDRAVVLFSNKNDDRFNLILASSNDLAINCASIISMVERYGGKGGGKEGFATGYLPLGMEDALLALENELKIQIYKQYKVER